MHKKVSHFYGSFEWLLGNCGSKKTLVGLLNEKKTTEVFFLSEFIIAFTASLSHDWRDDHDPKKGQGHGKKNSRHRPPCLAIIQLVRLNFCPNRVEG